MQAAHRVAKNTGILYIRMAITVFISLYATRLVLAALGVEDFGIFNVVGGAIAMLTFLNNAMTTATQRFMSYAEGEGNTEKQKNIFNVSMVLHLVTAVLVVLILEIAGYFLFNGILKIQPDRMEAAKMIYHFLVVSTFFTIVSVPYDAVINAHENMFMVAILGIIEAVIKLGIAIYITYATSDKLIIYGLLMAILSIFLLILRQIYCHRKYNEVEINFRKYYSKPLFKEMTGFAGWSFLGASSSMIGFYGQGLVLNMFFGTLVNAAQGIANQISGQLGAFTSTLLKAITPMIVKSEGAGNRDLMLKATVVGSKLSFFLLLFFVIPFLVETEYILNIWLKNVPEYAVIFCRLFLIQNLISQMYNTLSTSITAIGKIKQIQIANSVFNVLNILIVYFLFKSGFTPEYNYYVFIILAIITLIINIYYINIYCGLPRDYFIKRVILPDIFVFVILICIGFIPLLFLMPSIGRLIIVISITTLSFLASVWIIGFSESEKIAVKGYYKVFKIRFFKSSN